MNGALIHGLEARVNVIEDKLSDLDARTSEEADNALNERELDRFIMSGIFLNIVFSNSFRAYSRTFRLFREILESDGIPSLLILTFETALEHPCKCFCLFKPILP